MRVRHYVLLALAIAGITLGVLGCSSSSSAPSGTVDINTPAARLLANSWGMFSARVTGMTDLTVSWAMEPPGFGAVGHVRDGKWIANNLVLYKMPHTAGTHRLIATSSQSSSVKDQINVEIVNSWTLETPFTNYNSGGIDAGAPTVPTTFTLAAARRIVKVSVYHHDLVDPPTGTVTLTSGATTYGPYRTTPKFTVVDEGLPAEDYEIDANVWEVLLDQILPAGTYTITSSDPTTWSHSAASGHQGMATVEATVE